MPAIGDASQALVFTSDGSTVTGTWDPPIADPVTGPDMSACVSAVLAEWGSMSDPPVDVRFVFGPGMQ